MSLSAKILIPLAEYNRLKSRINQLENQLKLHVSGEGDVEKSEGAGVKDINQKVGKPIDNSDTAVPEHISELKASMSSVQDPLAQEGESQSPKKPRKWYYLGD